MGSLLIGIIIGYIFAVLAILFWLGYNRQRHEIDEIEENDPRWKIEVIKTETPLEELLKELNLDECTMELGEKENVNENQEKDKTEE